VFTTRTKLSMLKAVLTRDSPFYVQFYISKQCHLRCKMCNIVESNAALEPFAHEQIEPIADNLARIGAGVVLLTGGEPLLRDDIADIVRALKARHLDVRMQTAGLPARWDALAQCVKNGARDINVSIDSLDETISDYINGVSGSWRKAIRTIAYLTRVFPSRDSVCALGCVLSRYTIDDIEPVLDFATEIGWWLSLVPVHTTTVDRPLNFRGYDQYFAFTNKDYARVRALIDRLKEKKRQGYTLFDSDDYLESIYTFVSTGQPGWRAKEVCDSPNLYFVINPDGSFAPCCDHRFDQTLYVYSPDFPRIYRSREFRSAVRAITTRCPGCNFGSFPEMTLSARSLGTLRERVVLQMAAKRRSIRQISEDDAFAIIDRIKTTYPLFRSNRTLPLRDRKKWPAMARNIPQKLWNGEV
jgi:MoaA/NifB/PqqE/SkfB family radical SAM enzyme